MQKVFDIENKEDMQDLWSILPDDYCRIEKRGRAYCFYKITCGIDHYESFANFFNINWHDKTEITRPIQEATEDDVGKICAFWDEEEKCDDVLYGILTDTKFRTFQKDFDSCYNHCRRLTKQEIEELC